MLSDVCDLLCIVAWCMLFIVCCVLPVSCCSLPVDCCSMIVVCCAFRVVCSLLRGALLVGCCLPCALCGVLYVVGCL